VLEEGKGLGRGAADGAFARDDGLLPEEIVRDTGTLGFEVPLYVRDRLGGGG
jgi:hypothetical protein